MEGYDAGGGFADIADPAESSADHIPVKRLTIGSWHLLAKYDEHVLLSFYWAERKLVWEVLHLGVVRKMEVDFEDLVQATLTSGGAEGEPDKLAIELHRPPRFFKEHPSSAVSGGAQDVNYVYTTDFTNGQASTENRHVLLFDRGAITTEHTKMMSYSGIRLVHEGAGGADAKGGSGQMQRQGLLGRSGGGVHAMSAHLRQPPTSSPRLDAIILQDQLKREMRERQARYMGICPVRERVYANVLDELTACVGADAPKRGALLRRVTAEARMTIDAYRTVFEASIEFGSRKLTQARETKGSLAEQIEELEGGIGALQKEVSHLEALCESLEHREQQKELSYETRNPELIALEEEQAQLTSLLEVLRLSKPKPDAKG